jgi:hypothetical protein
MEVTKTKQENNQQILFELYLREKFEDNSINLGYDILEESGNDMKPYKNVKQILMEHKLINLKLFARLIDMNEKFENKQKIIHDEYSINYFEEAKNEIINYAKEFFEWAKKKTKELGMPKNTFPFICETKVLARNMFHQWYKQFKTSEEMLNWFEEKNDIMLK